VTQGDVVALLSVGSLSQPRDDVLQLGEAGSKQLVQVKQDGEDKGLAAYLQAQTGVSSGILNADGLPPMPPPLHYKTVKRYELSEHQPYGSVE
jgi:hypothetical protein